MSKNSEFVRSSAHITKLTILLCPALKHYAAGVDAWVSVVAVILVVVLLLVALVLVLILVVSVAEGLEVVVGVVLLVLMQITQKC